MEYEGEGDTNCGCWNRDNNFRIGTEIGRLRKRRGRDHPFFSITKICEKSPGDLNSVVVIQTPVIKPQLTLAWKTLRGVNHHNTQKKRKTKYMLCIDKWTDYIISECSQLAEKN